MNLCLNSTPNPDKPLDYINTHGTSTPIGDIMELAAIQRFSEGMYTLKLDICF